MRLVTIVLVGLALTHCKQRTSAESGVLVAGATKSYSGTLSNGQANGSYVFTFQTGGYYATSRTGELTNGGNSLRLENDDFGPSLALSQRNGRRATFSGQWRCEDALEFATQQGGGATGQCAVELVADLDNAAFSFVMTDKGGGGGAGGQGGGQVVTEAGTVQQYTNTTFRLNFNSSYQTADIQLISGGAQAVFTQIGKTLDLDRNASSGNNLLFRGTMTCLEFSGLTGTNQLSSGTCEVTLAVDRGASTFTLSGTKAGSGGGAVNPGSGGAVNPGSGGSGSGVTDRPESLPMGSRMDVNAVAAAICEARQHFDSSTNNSDSTISSCYNVVPPTWSPVMKYYYCQHSVYLDTQNTPGVRACFTGSLQGRGGYQTISTYRGTFDFCIQRPEFAWIRSSPARTKMFQYIMMSQVNASTGALYPNASVSSRFSSTDQTAAIQQAKSACRIP